MMKVYFGLPWKVIYIFIPRFFFFLIGRLSDMTSQETELSRPKFNKSFFFGGLSLRFFYL